MKPYGIEPVRVDDILSADRERRIVESLHGHSGPDSLEQPGSYSFIRKPQKGLIWFELTEAITYPGGTATPYTDNPKRLFHNHSTDCYEAVTVKPWRIYAPGVPRDWATGDYLEYPPHGGTSRFAACYNYQSSRWEMIFMDEELHFSILGAGPDSPTVVPKYGVFPVNAGRAGYVNARSDYLPWEMYQKYTSFGVNVAGRCDFGVRGPVKALWDNDIIPDFDRYDGTCGLLPGTSAPYYYHNWTLGPFLPGFRVVGLPTEIEENVYCVDVVSDMRTSSWLCKATGKWIETLQEPYVKANPCSDRDPSYVYDGNDGWPEIEIYVLLPRQGTGRDPNIQAGNILQYHIGTNRNSESGAGETHFAATGDYLDDKIGTVKFWNLATGAIPQGWKQYGSPGEFIRIGNSVATGSFGTTGTDYSYRDVVCIERFE